MRHAVVTTFHQKGLEQYGQRMIDSFIENWPQTTTLYVYAEDCEPDTRGAVNVVVRDLHASSPALVAFKNKWKDVPKANGDIRSIPELAQRKDSHKEFKWDAVRFAHKVYSIFACAKDCDAEFLIWMDADMVCHSPITEDDLKRLIGKKYPIHYIGRKNKWPECGLYAINIKKPDGIRFLKTFQSLYDDAEGGIFTLEEWHDSFVFQDVLDFTGIVAFDWAEGIITGEGHPLINCAWGKYLDHLKGDRKITGKSKRTDIVVKNRNEDYWKTI